MDFKKLKELINASKQNEAQLSIINTELLVQLVINTTRMVQIFEAELRKDAPVAAAPTGPSIPPHVEEPVAPVLEPKAKAKAPRTVKTPITETVAPAKELTKDAVLAELVNFIDSFKDGDGETALGEILKELGGYTQFPQVPAARYAELLEKINQG